MQCEGPKVERESQIRELLDEVTHGYLGVVGVDGWPMVRPVNFVYSNDRVYFHGSEKGEKMDALRLPNPRVTFAVVKDFSVIPSHFRDPECACPATQFYQAVMIRGRARIVECPEERVFALQALMEKLQPEGGYVPISADDPLYASAVRQGVAVVAIEIEDITGKFKVGQNLAGDQRDGVESGLRQRGCAIDRETLDAMKKLR